MELHTLLEKNRQQREVLRSEFFKLLDLGKFQEAEEVKNELLFTYEIDNKILKGYFYKLNKPMFLDILYNFIHDIKFRPIETGYLNIHYKRVK